MSETLSMVSIGANLLFIRLITKADDHGCFDARTKIIRGTVFPLMMDKVKDSDIEKWLAELEAVDGIRMWTHGNGVRYGCYLNFHEHNELKTTHNPKTPCPPWLLKNGADPRLGDKTADAFSRISAAFEILGDKASSSKICAEAKASKSTLTKYLENKESTRRYTSVQNGTDSTDKTPNPSLKPNPNLIKDKVRKRDFAQDRKRFDEFWKILPPEMKKGKDRAWLFFKNQVTTAEDFTNIQKALKHYITDTEQIRATKQPDLQFQNGSTWFNGRWKDYVEMAKPETWAERVTREKKEDDDNC